MKAYMAEIGSPIGDLVLGATDEGVFTLEFTDCDDRLRRYIEARVGRVELERGGTAERWAQPVRDYLAGRLDALDEIPVDAGGTAFQRSVWDALRRIPVGETRSYADIASAIDKPNAVRAVGAANGRNPVALIVPCHRVVGSDGTLTGYAGGLERKRWLLNHEGAVSPSQSRLGFLR
ncbi:MAG: methylated-DNA--[protein]-cysteine S-methyltransferase [bacterium]|nr:methylated-DNA--[protein]-cysteine S-methyltransferase [bacterium]